MDGDRDRRGVGGGTETIGRAGSIDIGVVGMAADAGIEAAKAPPVAIVFCVDEANLPHVAVTITSIVDNASGGPPIDFYVLLEGDASKIPGQFSRRRWRNHRVQLIACMLPPTGLKPFDHVSNAALLRLNIASFLPHLDRAIYLDADLIVVGDIRELFAASLDGKPLGAVLDIGLYSSLRYRHEVEHSLDLDRYLDGTLGFDPDNFVYVNSGVLLLDLQKLRKLDFSRRAFAMLAERGERLWWRDQDVINVLLKDRITLLDPKWNALQWSLYMAPERAYMQDEHEPIAVRQRAEPAILHYITRHKPWNAQWSSPTTGIWWQYAARTRPEWRIQAWQHALTEIKYKYYWPQRMRLRSVLVRYRSLRLVTYHILRLFGRGESFREDRHRGDATDPSVSAGSGPSP